MVAGRALILGAGALGNEVVKNLALMGLGYVLIADFDRVEQSNLSRGVFFRSGDVRKQKPKAELVAARSRVINVTSRAHVQTFNGDIVWQLGRGVFRRVDVVLGCLDNVEARIAANAACLLTGTPYIDGGILGLTGNVTAVHPPRTACWECITTAAERRNATDRYDSCARVMRRDISIGRLPAVQVASSIVAGFQTQEAVKVIQGQPWGAGHMIQYDASGKRPDLDVVAISRRPNCWCQYATTLDKVIEMPLSSANTALDLLAALQQQGVADPRIVLPGPFVVSRRCHNCRQIEAILQPAFTLDTAVLVCPSCGATRDKTELRSVERLSPEACAEVDQEGDLWSRILRMPLADLGFPQLALIHFADGSGDEVSLRVVELSADAVEVMGNDQFATVSRR
jgi:adenylyltransferase/sulfurtransferase